MPKPLFRGVCASSVTPFHPDGSLECLCHGSHGLISGIPSTVPAAARRLYERIAIEGNLPEARTLWQKLAPSMRLQFQADHFKGEGGGSLPLLQTTGLAEAAGLGGLRPRWRGSEASVDDLFGAG